MTSGQLYARAMMATLDIIDAKGTGQDTRLDAELVARCLPIADCVYPAMISSSLSNSRACRLGNSTL